jgi:cytoplasmic iron level regulating protein YaaA (DUF328/UPF0246 family)
MILLLSPAKTLDLTEKSYPLDPSQASFRSNAQELIAELRKYDKSSLRKLMSISDALAETNIERYHNFKKIHNQKNSKAAIYTFNGDVYRGLNAESFNKKDLAFAQDHLRILSGLYGYIKPMDLIQPYRLEMGSKLKNNKGKNLYEFWDNLITKAINKDLQSTKSDIILNLASNEYFSAVKKDGLKGKIVNIHFREYKKDELKFVSFTAKVARGMMSHYVIKNKLKKVEDLKGFDYEDYNFEEKLSSENELFFVR